MAVQLAVKTALWQVVPSFAMFTDDSKVITINRIIPTTTWRLPFNWAITFQIDLCANRRGETGPRGFASSQKKRTWIARRLPTRSYRCRPRAASTRTLFVSTPSSSRSTALWPNSQYSVFSNAYSPNFRPLIRLITFPKVYMMVHVLFFISF